ncbi:SCO7460 family lipoprotein [Streptomyces sp. NPDC050560]|uniref:SCO7460 family lipoprotein n=1 Tax=Streptomyces sp. NPDC050560 TaxID=3365630 RepID=UPI00378A0E6A
MSGRRTGWAMAVPLVLLLASGCATTTKADRRAARELAEKVYPGELRVVRAGTLFPETSGSEVTFALRDDPDAAVVLRMDAKRDDCGGEPCEEALRSARDSGERAAADWRALDTAFAGCGHRVLGVTAAGGSVSEPWIAAPLTNDTATAALTEVGACLQAWARALPGDGEAGRRTGMSVHIVAPEHARGLPGGRDGDPTVLRMSSRRLLAALSKHTFHTASFRWHGDTPVPGSGQLVRTQPFEEGQRFADRARGSVAAWLAAEHPDAAVVDAWSGVWHLAPGRVDRLRGYVLFCAGKPAAGQRCYGDRAALVTVDPQGRLRGTPAVLDGIRDERGALRLPPLPEAEGPPARDTYG